MPDADSHSLQISTRKELERIKSMRDFVAETIIAAILERRLLPGARVSPDVLGRELGVSHVPVREALHALEAEGYVERAPRRGFFVPALSVEEFEEVYNLREVLETTAYAQAVAAMGPEDIELCQELFDEMQRAADAQDVSGYARANQAFHLVPLGKARSAYLKRFLRVLLDASARYFRSVLTPSDLDELQGHHWELLEAFRSADAARVVETMTRHRQTTITAIARLQLPGLEAVTEPPTLTDHA